MNMYFINKKQLASLAFWALAILTFSVVSFAEGAADSKLPNNLVCMINNELMAREQIPTEVNGKTYYGCCPACAENLKNNQSTRYAEDPYSNEQVDKADSFIALKPNSQTEVHYFKSEENYINYVNSCRASNLWKIKKRSKL